MSLICRPFLGYLTNIFIGCIITTELAEPHIYPQTDWRLPMLNNFYAKIRRLPWWAQVILFPHYTMLALRRWMLLRAIQTMKRSITKVQAVSEMPDGHIRGATMASGAIIVLFTAMVLGSGTGLWLISLMTGFSIPYILMMFGVSMVLIMVAAALFPFGLPNKAKA